MKRMLRSSSFRTTLHRKRVVVMR